MDLPVREEGSEFLTGQNSDLKRYWSQNAFNPNMSLEPCYIARGYPTGITEHANDTSMNMEVPIYVLLGVQNTTPSVHSSY
jgi:hypothetical protein